MRLLSLWLPPTRKLHTPHNLHDVPRRFLRSLWAVVRSAHPAGGQLARFTLTSQQEADVWTETACFSAAQLERLRLFLRSRLFDVWQALEPQVRAHPTSPPSRRRVAIVLHDAVLHHIHIVLHHIHIVLHHAEHQSSALTIASAAQRIFRAFQSSSWRQHGLAH